MTGTRGNLVNVEDTELLSVPEAARRFEMDGVRIYELLLAGGLDGGPGADGSVRVSAASIRQYLDRQPAAG